MTNISRSSLTLGLVSAALLFCSAASAQVEKPVPRPRADPKVFVEPKPAEKTPAVIGIEERRRVDEGLKYSAFRAEPCAIVTRDELEAILKRSDNDRALVTMPTKPSWQFDRKKVNCSYSVNYQNRIFPDLGYDNAVVISIDFDNKYAKQGKLIVDPSQEPGGYADRELTLEIVNGVGDEALYLRDKSRFKYEEKFKSTAGAYPFQYYDNQESFYIRRRDIVLRFQVTRIVAGGGNSDMVIQIARKALLRVP
jgi:hypothetical protein